MLCFLEETLEVSCQNRSITLTRKEFGILVVLHSTIGRVCSREELLAKVWGHNVFVDARTIDRHVVQLRRKIMGLGQRELRVDTVWGLGYSLRTSRSVRN